MGLRQHDPLKITRLAVLLVCRNRRVQTLRAIAALVPPDGITLDIVLFDDDSTDGTIEAVLAARPDTVVVRGDGNAFWNGGLHRAWSRALGLPCDAFLWLNDDVELDIDALPRLLAAWGARATAQGDARFILVGATRGADGVITYGGQKRLDSKLALKFRLIAPASELKQVDTCNGNIVLVPRAVTDMIGINDPAFHHNFGDIDYGLRATRAGIPVLLLPGSLGVCELNVAKIESGYGSRKLGLRAQWRKVNTHHGLPFASWWHMTRLHSGAWQPFHFLLPYRWLVLPAILRRVDKGPT